MENFVSQLNLTKGPTYDRKKKIIKYSILGKTDDLETMINVYNLGVNKFKKNFNKNKLLSKKRLLRAKTFLPKKRHL